MSVNIKTMITTILFFVWLLFVVWPIFVLLDKGNIKPMFLWVIASVLWVIPIFTGVPVENNRGQYQGYATAVEQNGVIFRGWNVYLKTELESSNEDRACVDGNNSELISSIQEAVKSKESLTLKYVGVWQYPIGTCPGTDWMITGIIK